MSMMEARMKSLRRGQIATTEMIIRSYDRPPVHRWTMDEFHNAMAWPQEQAQGSGSGAAGAPGKDDDDDEDFEDAQDEEEYDSKEDLR